MKLSNAFEASMQSVSPGVALPYWDFTIETSTGTRVVSSPIMSARMFGSVRALSDDNKKYGYTPGPAPLRPTFHW